MLPVEMLGWSIEEILALIHRECPPGWVFEHWLWREERGACWLSTFRSGETTVWADQHVDERLNLLNAYGFIWARNQPVSNQDTLWRRQRELRTTAVRGNGSRLGILLSNRAGSVLVDGLSEEVPDLDPAEAQSVYESVHKKGIK